MSEKKERVCFNCVNFQLCFLRRGVSKATISSHLNSDASKLNAPGTRSDIFRALANCCLKYFELIEIIFEK